MSLLEARVNKIEERNKRVELDKAWETSNLRRILISLLTYIVISIFFLYNEVEKPFLNAIVPSVGFILSTVTLTYCKNYWIKKHSI